MAKQAEKARQIIQAQCEHGEQLRSVGLFWKESTGSLLLFWLIKTYWIGVTDKKLILIQLNSSSQPITNQILAVPLSDCKLQRNKIKVTLPGSEKPQSFGMRFGMKSATGFDVDEFKAALNQ